MAMALSMYYLSPSNTVVDKKNNKRKRGKIQTLKSPYYYTFQSTKTMGAEEGLHLLHNHCPTLIFTYGTLKKGFPNHPLLQNLIQSGDAHPLGVYCTADKYPLVCGPYKVPFLINLPGQGHHIWGELYAVSSHALTHMDELEGTERGHYERIPITVRRGEEKEVVSVEAYYAHRSYGEELWKRSGEMGISCYTHEEASGYIKRSDRPANTSFLDHIRLFLSDNE